MAVFSCGHSVLEDFFGIDIAEAIDFQHDPEGKKFPEVYTAWKKEGGGDCSVTVAKCISLGKWAVGCGGRKNAERAVKLSLALAIAADADPDKVAAIVGEYPEFGRLLSANGLDESS